MTARKSSVHPWWSPEASFFGPGYLNEYGPMLTAERTIAEVEFFTEIAGLSADNPRRILDCPCGHGRHAVLFAEDGHSVVGVDINPSFVGRAADAALSYGLDQDSVSFQVGDMRRLDFKEEFDVVMNLFTSFGYFADEADNVDSLESLVAAVKFGGLVIFDLMNRERIVHRLQEKDAHKQADGTPVLIERSFSLLDNRLSETRTRFGKRGRPTEHSINLHLYPLAEFANMLMEAGVFIETIYGNYTVNEPYAADSRRMIVVGRRE